MPEQKPLLDALNVSVIVDRLDQPGQVARTEWRTEIVLVGGTPAQAGDLAILGPNGQFDPSVIPGGAGSQVYVNGSAVSNPDFIDGDILWHVSGSDITATVHALATNTATPVVTNVSAPVHAGQLLISQPGNASAIWADPQVQGLFPPGTNADTGNSGGPIDPVLIGGRDTSGILRDVAVTPSGALIIVPEDEADAASHFAWDTGPDPKPITSGVLTPLLSIRPQVGATVVFFLIGSDIFMAPSIGEFQLIKNGVLTGAAFANVAGSNAQRDTAATLVSGGTRIDSGYTQNGTRTLSYQIGFIVGDTLTLAVQCQTGGIQKYANGALRWTEQPQPV